MWFTSILSQDAAQVAWLPAMFLRRLLLTVFPALIASSPPPGFPTSGNGLWFTSPGQTWSKGSLPIGNGYLAAMAPGGTTLEFLQLNIESLWSGGPFADPSYNGGNKQPDERDTMAEAMQTIRQSIFQSSTGDINDISVLTTDQGAYGSYVGSGYLVTALNSTGSVSDYGRYLDFDDGITRTIWTQSSTTYTRTTFCSGPARSCTQHITTASNSTTLPALTYAFSSALQADLPTPNVTCLNSNSISVRGLASNPGMLYELVFRVSASPVHSSALPPNITCNALSSTNATLVVSHAQSAWITWVGDTDYSMDAGNEAHSFSFKGVDPHDNLVNLMSRTRSTTYQDLLSQHITDYHNTFGSFQLSIGQEPDLSTPTDILRANYEPYFPATSPSSRRSLSKRAAGSPYLEYLTFNLGRYLLYSSTRSAIPANLQGKWAQSTGNPWGADYHSNINIQMNYWSAEMSFIDSKSIIRPLFDYFEKTWAPRGSYTAQVLYNISRGWVTHNEMNIFGHTGMKGISGTAQWADYPESNVWMMIHVFDHFDYTGDVEWWKSQGWPLLKGVASFHLDKLIPDSHFNDSTLVVNPCNSPEQPPITFGCAHAQQLIWQLFNSIEKGFAASGDTDTAFLDEVRAKRTQMDKGLHVGSWGQLQEWKVDQDQPTDTHRHLSHLIGLYPGYAITSYDPAVQNASVINQSSAVYSKQQILDATTTSLIHRGNGTGPDADAGWEKAWRAAAWAQLGNKEEFYRELTYTVSEDFGPNLFSLYDPQDPDPIFQIDANLGYPGAVLNALLQAPDVPSYTTPLIITLLPALPTQWANGFIKGARVRGGMTVDLSWSSGVPTSLAVRVDSASTNTNNVQRFDPVQRPVKVVYDGKTVLEFETTPGLTRSVAQF